jgi:putative spermidine/putrescine transport system ATP-binding protein
MLPAGSDVPDIGTAIRLSWQQGDVHYMDDAA